MGLRDRPPSGTPGVGVGGKVGNVVVIQTMHGAGREIRWADSTN